MSFGSMEISSNKALIESLKKLNPHVAFNFDDTYGWIQLDCDVQTLKLPNGFYANEKNGITNKHRTKTGTYIALTVI